MLAFLTFEPCVIIGIEGEGEKVVSVEVVASRATAVEGYADYGTD